MNSNLITRPESSLLSILQAESPSTYEVLNTVVGAPPYVILPYYYDSGGIPYNLSRKDLVEYSYVTKPFVPGNNPKFDAIRSLHYDCIVATGMSSDIYIAGSSVAAMFGGFEYNDIDVFFHSAEAFHALLGQMCKKADKLVTNIDRPDLKDHLTVDFIYRGKRVQLVKSIWFKSIAHLYSSFDFSITKFAINHGSFITTTSALNDIKNKMLVLDGKCGSGTKLLYRLVKYVRKGYSVPGDTINSIVKFMAANPDAVDDRGTY